MMRLLVLLLCQIVIPVDKIFKLKNEMARQVHPLYQESSHATTTSWGTDFPVMQYPYIRQ